MLLWLGVCGALRQGGLLPSGLRAAVTVCGQHGFLRLVIAVSALAAVAAVTVAAAAFAWCAVLSLLSSKPFAGIACFGAAGFTVGF